MPFLRLIDSLRSIPNVQILRLLPLSRLHVLLPEVALAIALNNVRVWLLFSIFELQPQFLPCWDVLLHAILWGHEEDQLSKKSAGYTPRAVVKLYKLLPTTTT